MPVSISRIDTDLAILECPRCGEHYLHQGTVEVFNRPAEDGPTRSVVVGTKSGPIVGDANRNPSARRQGLIIEFQCENCGDFEDGTHKHLKIYQHKGQTFFEWSI